LTFIYRNQKETLNFIQGKALQNIPLKPWKNYWSLF
jgi:hypothetical protein